MPRLYMEGHALPDISRKNADTNDTPAITRNVTIVRSKPSCHTITSKEAVTNAKRNTSNRKMMTKCPLANAAISLTLEDNHVPILYRENEVQSSSLQLFPSAYF